MSKTKRKYALYYNPARTYPWTIVGEYKNIWWSEIHRTVYKTEDEALADLKTLVNLEIDHQSSLGEKIRDWHPE